MRQIALVGDYDPGVTAHLAIPKALTYAFQDTQIDVRWTWVQTVDLRPDATEALQGFDALWCVPASPYRNTEGVLEAIRWARENGKPFLGTCGGYQHAVLEYARNVWKIEAAHGELEPSAENPVIGLLDCALVETGDEVIFEPGSRLREIYGAASAFETYHCRYGINPLHANRLASGPLRIAGKDVRGGAKAIELDGHPFFIGTGFQPERTGLNGSSHPVINAFLRSVAKARATKLG